MAIVNQLCLLARLHAEAAESFEVFGPDLIELAFGFAGGEADIEVRKKIIRVPGRFGLPFRGRRSREFGWRSRPFELFFRSRRR